MAQSFGQFVMQLSLFPTCIDIHQYCDAPTTFGRWLYSITPHFFFADFLSYMLIRFSNCVVGSARLHMAEVEGPRLQGHK
jgi:hypothetical protein